MPLTLKRFESDNVRERVFFASRVGSCRIAGTKVPGYVWFVGKLEMNMVAEPLAKPAHFALLTRVRYRLAFGTVICVVGPLLALQAYFGTMELSPTQINTAVGSAVSIILGYVGYRRLHVFPGINEGGYIVTSFTVTFAILAYVLMAFRFEYSRLQFIISYSIALLFFTYLHFRIDAGKRLRFGIVPGGMVGRLPDMAQVSWLPLNEAQVAADGLDGIVVDLHHDHSDVWDVRITGFVLQGIPVYHVKQALEQLTGRVEVASLSENTLGSLNPNDVFLKAKTVVDMLAAAWGLILLSPIMLIVGLAIKLDSPGPALFRQERVGFRARTFTVYKFRTMRVQQASGVDDARSAAITLDNDPRITRLGRFLRRSRLDELPQLFNILKGDMSLIGPRPEALALSQWYERELPFYHYRHIIKPGVTGWAQINQGHVADVNEVLEKLHYDFYYVKNFSFWLDILIIIRTAMTMITGRGAK
jgi:lipopolysaccharide/colanic/teichoic acid biosynthesis glycosyltransferase